MGDPKKLRKKYSAPAHPYQKDRIDEENKLVQAYGLSNKREIWKAQSVLKKYRTLARNTEALSGEEKKIKAQVLMAKLIKMGLIKEGSTLDDVLALTVTDVLDRRLQTLAYKKGLATTMKQARQFIVHGHVAVNGRRMDSPSYMVLVKEEDQIGYYGKPLEIKPKEQNIPAAPEAIAQKAPETKPAVPSTKPSIPTKEEK